MGWQARIRSTAAFCSTVYLRSWLPWLWSRLRAAPPDEAEAPDAFASGIATFSLSLYWSYAA